MNNIIFVPGKFLSTLSLRRATNQQPAGTTRTTYFYPRSPCGERLRLPTALRTPHHIFLSTLSLRRATYLDRQNPERAEFLSTLSLRRATLRVVDGSKSSIISIHALLAESDGFGGYIRSIREDFYPRSPCGERHS